MHWLIALLSGNSTFLTSSVILLGFGRLDGPALLGAGTVGVLTGLAAALMLVPARK